MNARLQRVLQAVDAANGLDPARVWHDGEELAQAVVYGRRISAGLGSFIVHPSEHLAIAARAQHIERWTIPRQAYPEGRIGYLTWRKDLQKHHALQIGQIMRLEGYDEAAIGRVASLLRKERLKQDPEAQALEDVVCLVFLAFEAPAFIAKHDDDKVRAILAKTALKMSDKGWAAAAKLSLDARLARLLKEAGERPPAI